MRLPTALPLVVVFVVFVVGVGCGDAPTPPPKAPAPKRAAQGAEVFFPLEEGRIYHYVTNEAGEPGMLVARVHRADATHGELRLSNASKRFVYSPDGVAYDGGAFILKSPIDVGSTWPGEHGGTTRITSVTTESKVPAGSYSGCVETVEDGGRPPGSKYVTTYCPGVGMVSLVVSAGGAEARAELKSYGMPVKIE